MAQPVFFGAENDAQRTVSDYEVEVFLELWQDITRVRVNHRPPRGQSGARAQPLPVPVVRDTESPRGRSQAPRSRPNDADTVMSRILDRRRRAGRTSSEQDRQTLEWLRSELGRADFESLEPVWRESHGPPVLRQIPDRTELDRMIDIAERRLGRREFFGANHFDIDFSALDRIRQSLARQDVVDVLGRTYHLDDYPDAISMVPDHDGLAVLLARDPLRAHAILELASRRARLPLVYSDDRMRPLTTRTDAFGALYETIGREGFVEATARGVLDRGDRKQAMQVSAEHYDASVKLIPGDASTQVIDEDNGDFRL